MGLFGRNKQTTEQIEALRAELAAVRERLDGADAAKAQLEESVGALRAENGRLRDELLVQITTSATASNDATRTLAEQTAAHLDEQRARLADLAVVATDAAERAAAAGGLDEAAELRVAEAERRVAEAEERLAAAERAVQAATEEASTAGERIGTVDARLTQVSTELANQLAELSGELDAAAARSASVDDEPVVDAEQSLGLDPELVEELLDAQERLAAEQARYQIAFRQDLADLADRLKRQR